MCLVGISNSCRNTIHLLDWMNSCKDFVKGEKNLCRKFECCVDACSGSYGLVCSSYYYFIKWVINLEPECATNRNNILGHETMSEGDP